MHAIAGLPSRGVGDGSLLYSILQPGDRFVAVAVGAMATFGIV